MIQWETCKDDFRWDGSLRDIYITPATLGDWQALYPLLRDYPEVEYSVDSVAQPPPASVEQVLAIRPSGSPMLRVKFGRTLIVFHFFSDEEIECDIDPRQMTSQTDLDSLSGFVRLLGDTTNKRVVITPENVRDEPFISYSPETRMFKYHEVAI
jgi:hypothetical protein